MLHTQLLISMPGGTEWLIIGLIIVLLFGAKKIPDLARGLGKGMKEFKDAKEGGEDPKNKPTTPGATNVTEDKF